MTLYREYGPGAVGVVRFIKRAKELGFSLAEVEARQSDRLIDSRPLSG